MTIVTVTLNPSLDRTFSVEQVVADRELAGADVREDPGGGGINVARVATRLGGEVRARWSCGGDTGRRLARLLDIEVVPHEPVRVQGAVRENLVVRDRSTSQQHRFGMPGPTLTEAERRRSVHEVRQLPPSVSYLVFSGSLPGGTSAEWYGELLRSAPESARIVVDTKQETLRQALQVGVFLIKPNLRELAEVSGRELADDAAIEQAPREIIARGGAEVAVVSLGRGGALLVTAETSARFSAWSRW